MRLIQGSDCLPSSASNTLSLKGLALCSIRSQVNEQYRQGRWPRYSQHILRCIKQSPHHLGHTLKTPITQAASQLANWGKKRLLRRSNFL